MGINPINEWELGSELTLCDESHFMSIFSFIFWQLSFVLFSFSFLNRRGGGVPVSAG